MQTILIVFISVIIAAIVLSIPAMLIPTMKTAKKLYNRYFVKDCKDKWPRSCSAPDNKEHFEMYNLGMQWGNKYIDKMTEVRIKSFDNLNLAGQYFDFGFSNAVIIVSGRSESVNYCYFFAEPYQKNGYNVLVIDSRAHGESEGIYNSVSILESNDVVSWLNFLEIEKHNTKTLIHGICIGGATAVLAATKSNCPKSLAGLVTEGMFYSFYDMFKGHIKFEKKPTFPVLQEMRYLFKKHAKVDIKKESPKKHIGQLNIPILMMYAVHDQFIPNIRGKQLYALAGSKLKKLVWFEKGNHSHLRKADAGKYDEEITEFLGLINSSNS